MKSATKTSIVFVILSVAFIAVAAWFLVDSFAEEKHHKPDATYASGVYTNVATVRQSVSGLKATGGDMSGLDCYACHDRFGEKMKLKRDKKGKIIVPKEHQGLVFARMNCVACHEKGSVELKFDDNFNVIVPEAHEGPAMHHGSKGRNNNCFTCHVRDNLPMLKTAQNEQLPPEKSTQLCAGCHGPKYQEWEAGIHGRASGYWNEEMGPRKRKDCTACHDPHLPMFPKIEPGPPPDPAHEKPESDNHSTERTQE